MNDETVETQQNKLKRLGHYKDGVTVTLALIFFVVGFYQYFEVKAERKISMSLNILERREDPIFVKARTTILQKWFVFNQAEFLKTSTYTPELLASIEKLIQKDSEYRTALQHISTFYVNAAACVLDNLCDKPTICLSLLGEIQDYLDVNKNYFIYLRRVRGEDSLSFYIGLDVFTNQCISNYGPNIFSRMDQSWSCHASLKLYRITGIELRGYCKGSITGYAKEIINAAKMPAAK